MTVLREGAEFVEVLVHPTTTASAGAVFVEILVGAPQGPFPLRLFPRNDDLDGPRLPQYHDSAERSVRLGGTTYE